MPASDATGSMGAVRVPIATDVMSKLSGDASHASFGAKAPAGPLEVGGVAGAWFLAAPAPLVAVSREGRILVANEAFGRLVQRAPATLVGESLGLLSHPADAAGLLAELRRAERDETRPSIVNRYLGPGGEVLMAEHMLRSVGAGGDEVVLVAAWDVTGEEEAARALAHQAFHDPLTGLANRALFDQRLETVLIEVGEGKRAGLLLLDLDEFKGVNDSLGHGVGDDLLCAFAERLRRSTRNQDLVCRFGGDEFLVLVDDVGSVGELEEIAQRILRVLDEPFSLPGRQVTQKASIGIVPIEPGTTGMRSLLEHADSAMYEAKRKGKGRACVFDEKLHAAAVLRFGLAQDLAQALGRGELAMHYQPLVELCSGEVVGFEALMRWRHSHRGEIAPELFIDIAEASGLIGELGAFAVFEATQAVMGFSLLAGMHVPFVSVNVSTHQLRDPGLVRIVEDALTASGLEPDRLVLELTESAALGEVDAATEALRRLGELGVRVAIDDFGTGYSSLSYLPRLQPALIKVDRSFVSGRGADEETLAVLEGVVSIGHSLQATVLAEGIETTADLALCRQAGCELGQGWLFAKPVARSEVPAMLRRLRAERAQLLGAA